MGKHSSDKCEVCGKEEKNMTFVSWYPNGSNAKGALLCKQHERQTVRVYTQKDK